MSLAAKRELLIEYCSLLHHLLSGKPFEIFSYFMVALLCSSVLNNKLVKRELICYRCGEKNTIEELVGRADTCIKCGSYLRCCLNCDFYDEGYHNKCREPQSELISDKESANFCDFFAPNTRRKSKGSENTTADIKQRFDALFKK